MQPEESYGPDAHHGGQLQRATHAVQCACYCINRSPTSNNEKTPFEMVTREKPDEMLPFYAPEWITSPRRSAAAKRAATTRSHEAEPSRILGYSPDCAGAYLVLSLHTRSALVRSN